jgi:hypothetical protein
MPVEGRNSRIISKNGNSQHVPKVKR